MHEEVQASGPPVYGEGDQVPVALFLRGEPRGRGKFAGSSFRDVELRRLTELSGEGSWLGTQIWGHRVETET